MSPDDESLDDIEDVGAEASDADTPTTDDKVTGTTAVAARRRGVVARRVGGARTRIGVIALVAVLVISGAVAAWLFVNQYRPDRETDSAAAKIAIDAASGGTVAILSYSPDSLDKDFATAKSHLTGDFLSYYTQFTDQVVKPAVQQKAVSTTATVVRAGVSDIRPDSAVVLVFVNQKTTSKENPGGALAASSVKVAMTKVDGRWLISAFDPV